MSTVIPRVIILVSEETANDGTEKVRIVQILSFTELKCSVIVVCCNTSGITIARESH